MIISRTWAMPNSNTFSIKPIREFVERYVHGVVVDPFARDSRYAGEFSNDLNPNTSATHHMEAREFLEMLVGQSVQADVILFDPPYSLRQIKECYEGVGKAFLQKDSQETWRLHKDLCDRLLKPEGVFLHFGWHSNGLGKNRGLEIIELLLVAHGRVHNDTICIAERRKEVSVVQGVPEPSMSM